MQLGLEKQLVTNIEGQYHDAKEQRYEALTLWVRKESQATYRKMYDILCDLEEKEAAEKVAELSRGQYYILVLDGIVCVYSRIHESHTDHLAYDNPMQCNPSSTSTLRHAQLELPYTLLPSTH